ncbi:hypothetical protein DPMN_118751 [Dreissena polymorpha]|uniref:Uncharacterized protein n=1 Tax=Dreissena polymorpha TaxID=45954 RepID=A0A9D4JNS9_DREPO|nr:hypothetical protein DPMN_118751 [Dreissena polymorpha]
MGYPLCGGSKRLGSTLTARDLRWKIGDLRLDIERSKRDLRLEIILYHYVGSFVSLYERSKVGHWYFLPLYGGFLYHYISNRRLVALYHYISVFVSLSLYHYTSMWGIQVALYHYFGSFVSLSLYHYVGDLRWDIILYHYVGDLRLEIAMYHYMGDIRLEIALYHYVGDLRWDIDDLRLDIERSKDIGSLDIGGTLGDISITMWEI